MKNYKIFFVTDDDQENPFEVEITEYSPRRAIEKFYRQEGAEEVQIVAVVQQGYAVEF